MKIKPEVFLSSQKNIVYNKILVTGLDESFIAYVKNYIIEDFKYPNYYKFLNNSNGKELLIDQLINKIKIKKYFDSKILSKKDQNYLFKNIKKIIAHKGIAKQRTKIISDIIFIQKK